MDPRGLRRIISFLYSRYAIRQFALCDSLISVTPGIVRQLERYNNKVCMVTNYPHYSGSKTAKGANSSRALCFTGQIEENWCHAEIIESIEEIDNCVYRLCGPADEQYLDQLKKLPGWEKTDYLGFVSFDKAQEIQREAAIGMAVLRPSLNTSGKEGTLGNTKIFEYMNEDLPFICTDFILWKEIVDKYHCGICVDPTNVKEIVSAVNYLFSHSDKAKQMGINGRKAIEQEFNWGTQEKVLLNLYADLGEGVY